ncbi:hypothetical protein [Paraburkholderia sediminicola]|uniref:hypothetical protein n=1 Tax=Paraburkholderia sediminicola TaxID=458836 RepID=UPI00158422E4|nr:hypothetical protein [Paraburkholderia sediminicola]
MAIRLSRKKRSESVTKRFGLVDVAAIVAVFALVMCEFMFPLADKDFSEQAAQPLVTLKLLAAPAENAMERFDKARSEFFENTMGHTRDIGAVGMDADQLLGLELQYLSYYRVASVVLLDELSRMQMLENDISKVETSILAKQLPSSFNVLIALQPKLDDCFKKAFTAQHAIDAALQAGPNETTKTSLMISTLSILPDFIRVKKAHWLDCQNSLIEFDRRLSDVAAAYPAVIEQLDARSEWQKKMRTVMRWLATLLLFYCGQLYRRRWMEAASSTLGG